MICNFLVMRKMEPVRAGCFPLVNNEAKTQLHSNRVLLLLRQQDQTRTRSWFCPDRSVGFLGTVLIAERGLQSASTTSAFYVCVPICLLSTKWWIKPHSLSPTVSPRHRAADPPRFFLVASVSYASNSMDENSPRLFWTNKFILKLVRRIVIWCPQFHLLSRFWPPKAALVSKIAFPDILRLPAFEMRLSVWA